MVINVHLAPNTRGSMLLRVTYLQDKKSETINMGKLCRLEILNYGFEYFSINYPILFDNLSRICLWQIMERLGSLRKFLNMIIQLHKNQYGQVRHQPFVKDNGQQCEARLHACTDSLHSLFQQDVPKHMCQTPVLEDHCPAECSSNQLQNTSDRPI